MIDFERGQGATEYLLMLAAVLVVVATAVYFVMGTGPSFTITPAAGYPSTAPNDNHKVVFTVDSVTPDNVTVTSVSVITPDGKDCSGLDTSKVPKSLTSGETFAVSCDSAILSGSKLQITAEGSTKSFNIDTD